jgi:hypothetical protein
VAVTDGSLDPGSDLGLAFFLGYGDIPSSTLESLVSSDIAAFQSGAAVPEPSTWALMVVGGGMLGALATRKRKTDTRRSASRSLSF